MKKSLITLTVMLAVAAMVVVFCGPAMAQVSGRCDNCHTMHNSQGGNPMAIDRSSLYGSYPELGTPPYGTLLTDTCIGCHSHNSQTQRYSQPGGGYVPVVFYTGGDPGGVHLAGGNFAYVNTYGDAHGHNVLGISSGDVDLAAGAPGGQTCYGVNCHVTLAEPQVTNSEFGSGCQGCHLRPAHHANDHANNVGGLVNSAAQGSYRFLSGHNGAGPNGVHGYEDGDWQMSANATDHNEYLGVPGGFQSANHGLETNHSMTAYCCGCHGNFHQQQNGSNEWIRHPSDAMIKNEGEYADAFDLDGNGSHIYDPLVPVARQTLPTSPGTLVQIGGANADMVMCLSCHRPHGSPYADILRWNYQGSCDAGGSTENCGCMQCHTQKGT